MSVVPEARGRGIRSRLEATGRRQGWWGKERLLVAVSGGGDSVALLFLLHRFAPNPILAATLDHGIRGEASREDAAFVEGLCKAWGIPCRKERVSVPELRKRGESLEAAARRVRYAFLERVAEEESARPIALAHNRDDAVETVLMNLARGSGIDGIGGMPETRFPVVRPLLSWSREELRSLLAEEGIPWREDETNQDEGFLRNRLRRRVLPLLREEVNGRIDDHLLALADEARRVREVQSLAEERLLRWVTEAFPGAGACWRRDALARLDEEARARLVRLQAKLLGMPVLDRNRTVRLAGLLLRPAPWCFQWGGGFEIRGGSRIGWLRPGEGEPEETREVPLSREEERLVPFGPFLLRFGVARLSAPGEEDGRPLGRDRASGGFAATLRLPSPRLRLLPLASCPSDGAAVPSWARPRWPLVRGENGSGWSPLLGRSGPIPGSDCVIIVPVRVIRDGRRGRNESWDTRWGMS
jgi:tRNA(Ile)-lysidine synthase